MARGPSALEIDAGEAVDPAESSAGRGRGTLKLDPILFYATVLLIAVTCVPIALAPEQASVLVTSIYDWIAGEFGLLYQWMTLGAAIVLAVIAFGRHGRRRLGGDDATPDYNRLSWMAMMFCAGIGAGLLYWAPIEWAFYLDEPPFGLAAGSPMAREWAATYGIFHWGFSAWCIYCLPAIAIAWPYYQRGIPYLRLSTALAGLLGDDIGNRPLGRAVDFVFIVALIAGAGTSLGLATPMIAACVGALFGIPESLGLDIAIAAVAAALFAGSVYLGLDRGIRRLSDLNAGIAISFAALVLLVGPTAFALKLGTNSLGLTIQHFVRLNTWTDPILASGFIENWSIFYWAWWLAYAPFVGIFAARISRGRTLREMIFAMVGFGTLGCALFYVALGNTAMWMDMQGLAPVAKLVADGVGDTAIATFVAALPLQPLMLVAFVAMAFIFVATTYDSASYAIAAVATRGLVAGANPARWHRVFWALALMALPVTLMTMGGLRAIQSAVLVASVPLLAIGLAMTVALFKSLREA